MRYRKQDANGDYTFGGNTSNFFVNEPSAVAQAISTRLKLFLGEYFADTTQGMPWQTRVLGYHAQAVYDAAIRARIAETPGFVTFVSYSSALNRVTRVLTVNAVVTTAYSNQPTALQVAMLTSGYGIGGYGDRPYGS